MYVGRTHCICMYELNARHQSLDISWVHRVTAVQKECTTPPHVQVCQCTWLSFSRPSPTLVLQATNAGVDTRLILTSVQLVQWNVTQFQPTGNWYNAETTHPTLTSVQLVRYVLCILNSVCDLYHYVHVHCILTSVWLVCCRLPLVGLGSGHTREHKRIVWCLGNYRRN